MLYNVYDKNNQLIGQVEASSITEAWGGAITMYQVDDTIVLDVRPVTEKTFRKYTGEDADPILNAVETYMKNLHKGFYENMTGENDSTEVTNRIEELTSEKNELNTEFRTLRSELDVLRVRKAEESKTISYYKQMLTRVKKSINRLGGEELSDEQILRALGVVDKYYEAMAPTDGLNERIGELNASLSEISQRIKEINRELRQIRPATGYHKLKYRG